MTLNNIYDKINEIDNVMKDISHDDLYNKLIPLYSKSKVDFVMYDLFEYQYDGLTKTEREKRKDDKFIKDVRSRYNNVCIMTGTDMCQVCHIVPFSECKENEKYDVNNGILLRDDIHRLFDKKEIKINPDTFVIEVSESTMKNNNRRTYHKLNNIIVNINKNSISYLRRVY